MNYKELRDLNSKEFNAFPMIFAYSDKQLKKGKKELGVKDNKDLLSIGGGGIIRKSDKEAYAKLTDELFTRERDFLKDKDNLLEALIYELGNHEYCITGDKTDALLSLSLDIKTMTDEQVGVLKQAIKIYWSKHE